MAKNNLTTEFQELIQYIKTNYQEGKDYKYGIEKLYEKHGTAFIKISSYHLKNYCREKFNFPQRVNDYLDYEKIDKGGNDFHYRISKDNDYLSFSDSRV